MFTTPLQVKLIVKEMLHDMDLTSLVVGTVSSISPLKIRVNQRLEITSESLYFCKNVIPWKLDTSHYHAYIDEHAEGQTASGGGETHSHFVPLTETEKVTAEAPAEDYVLEDALMEGDKVLLLKNMGGQEFVLLDKLRKYEEIVTCIED